MFLGCFGDVSGLFWCCLRDVLVLFLGCVGFVLVIHPVGSIVQQEKYHVHKPERRGHASRGLRQPIAGVAPERFERFP